ncbi:MAG: hypothetical protein HQ559_18590, partial [Lentisphaerae bacterium]|nr:hypothetical protein [Lentisphaerota bacterium]
MRYLERRKTDRFRRRQRLARLLAPAAVLALLVVYDLRVLIAWDPYYRADTPTAPVWAAGMFLALNVLVLRLLLYLWFEVKWVFFSTLFRRLPGFVLQALVFAVPFVPPLLALKNYTIHETQAFRRRFPACRQSRHVDAAPPARRFQDTRHLYCLYGVTESGKTEIRVVRFRRGSEEDVRRLRNGILNDMTERLEASPPEAGDAIRAGVARQEADALRGKIDDVLVTVVQGAIPDGLTFRVWRRRLVVSYHLRAQADALFACTSVDRGATWSAPVECEPADSRIRDSRVPK